MVVTRSIPDLNIDTKTIGGRGGDIYFVTNLNDSGKGSLRYGLEGLKGPRNIVFETSGDIELVKNIVVKNPYVTVFGQTAPGGIQLVNAGICIRTYEVILQHIAIRPGDNIVGQPPGTRDALEIIGTKARPTKNIVINHCSLTHAVDENIGIWGSCSNIIISNCIIAAALNNSIHPKGPHSKGILIGAGGRKVTLYRNLLAFNKERNPRIAGDTEVNFVENYIYSCVRGIQILDKNRKGAIKFNGEKNVFSPKDKYNIRIKHISDNSVVKLSKNSANIGYKKLVKNTNRTFRIEDLTEEQESSITNEILNNAGAIPWKRNRSDLFLLQKIKTKSRTLFDGTKKDILLSELKIDEIVDQYIRAQEVKSFASKNNCINAFIKIRNQNFKISTLKKNKGYIELKTVEKVDKYSGIGLLEKRVDSVFPIYSIQFSTKLFPFNEQHYLDHDGNGYSQLEDYIYSEYNNLEK